MVEIREQFVTVAKAAELLEVSTSTIWRWIDKGDIPAYRFGHRRVLIKQKDLEKLITPARGEKGDAVVDKERERLSVPLTKTEQQRALSALDEAQQLAQRLLERRGGVLFPSSWKDLDEARAERARQLQ